MSRMSDDVNHLQKIVSQSTSVSEACRKLGYKPSGSIHKMFKIECKKHAIDTSHFTGQAWAKGKSYESHGSLRSQSKKTRKPWSEVFRKGSSMNNTSLMKRLLRSGKLKYECSECRLSTWKNKPIRLVLDHINGDNTDCREENLRLLCPNCDSQTDTFCRGMREKASKELWWIKYSKNAAVHQSGRVA